MELIIDSADVAQIKVLKELCTVAGVTTNPTILTKSGREATEVIQDLIDILDEDQKLFIQGKSGIIQAITKTNQEADLWKKPRKFPSFVLRICM